MMFVGSWPRIHNAGRMVAHQAGNGNSKKKFAEIGLAFFMVSIGKNYRHRNTKCPKMSQFLNSLPPKRSQNSALTLTQSAPNFTYSHDLSLKNFLGEKPPGPPLLRGSVDSQENH